MSNKHPLFDQKFLSVPFRPLRDLFNQFLSNGGATYYMLRDGITTKFYLYNYFAQLAGQPFSAEWTLTLYSQKGDRSKTVSGKFRDVETVVVNAEDVASGFDDMGVCLAHIRPTDRGRSMRVSYPTIFFAEFLTEHGRAFIHSNAYPVPRIHEAHDLIVGSVNPKEFPFLLVSNSCDRVFGIPRAVREVGPTIKVENHRGETREHGLEPIAPLGCRMVRLEEIWRDLPQFFEDKPGVVHVSGPNVLYSPLIVLKRANVEHFQGLKWRDVPAPKER